MSDDKNTDGEYIDAEVTDVQKPVVVTAPSGDGEVEIEVQAGKTTVSPTSSDDEDDE